MVKVGIVGGSGYTGGELLRILTAHPKIKIAFVTSRKYAGKIVSSVHPNLRNFCELNFIQFSPGLIKDCDLVFLCLPHGESMKIVKEIFDKVKIIDLSADFRIKNKEHYEKYYSQHLCPELLEKTVYGLTELHKEEIRNAKLVGNPGCIATSVILALHPLNKILNGSKVAVDVKIGSSAAGRSANLSTIHTERTGIVRPYHIGNHRHLAEIEQELGINNIGITAHAVDLVRGILSTCHIFVDNLPTLQELREIYREHYQNEPFVRIVVRKNPPYNLPDVKTVNYTNFCEIGFATDEHSNRIIVFSALDNMIKGAAGQAVQNMNLMFGFDETLGLNLPGFYV